MNTWSRSLRWVDRRDSSLCRSDAALQRIFAAAGLQLLAKQAQQDWPETMLPVSWSNLIRICARLPDMSGTYTFWLGICATTYVWTLAWSTVDIRVSVPFSSSYRGHDVCFAMTPIADVRDTLIQLMLGLPGELLVFLIFASYLMQQLLVAVVGSRSLPVGISRFVETSWCLLRGHKLNPWRLLCEKYKSWMVWKYNEAKVQIQAAISLSLVRILDPMLKWIWMTRGGSVESWRNFAVDCVLAAKIQCHNKSWCLCKGSIPKQGNSMVNEHLRSNEHFWPPLSFVIPDPTASFKGVP